MRYFIKFSYNGTHYHGWQYQPNATSVQETLTKAISTVLNTTVELMGAGRTDTGVHAKVMYAHFDLDKPFEAQSIVHKLNSFLPKDIAVFEIIPVHDDAHARFDAKKRTYEYHINTFKDVFQTELSWYNPQKLDVDLMNEAAKILLEHTDFECFSKVHTDVNTFNCKISEAYWQQNDNHLIFTISADRFLRNMVRAIVGTLINVGLHKITNADFEAIINSKNRSEAGFSVPAHGLYLTEITYEYVKPSPDGSGNLFVPAFGTKN
ncbi:tRNA pseudouridine(38-40) synthase TruA [Flavobacterium sp.]|uniref:tRNA pseudouridine(38-40) synthase TruA n=1 Tax=Flavobacterium sp. TaxID=239 RepID=UPI002630A218|nr:tRNA pseudouridine(38-40) synthase TruA [Flavobacterium sp.]